MQQHFGCRTPDVTCRYAACLASLDRLKDLWCEGALRQHVSITPGATVAGCASEWPSGGRLRRAYDTARSCVSLSKHIISKSLRKANLCEQIRSKGLFLNWTVHGSSRYVSAEVKEVHAQQSARRYCSVLRPLPVRVSPPHGGSLQYRCGVNAEGGHALTLVLFRGESLRQNFYSVELPEVAKLIGQRQLDAKIDSQRTVPCPRGRASSLVAARVARARHLHEEDPSCKPCRSKTLNVHSLT